MSTNPARQSLLPSFRRRLGVRFVFLVFAVVLISAASATALRLHALRVHNQETLERFLQEVAQSFVPTIAENIWTMNGPLLQTNLHGLTLLPSVVYAEVTGNDGRVLARAGERTGNDTLRTFPLYRQYKGEQTPLGRLALDVTMQPAIEAAWREFLYDSLTYGSMLGILTVLILLGMHIMIAQPLAEFADAARSLGPEQLDRPLVVRRSRLFGKGEDEIDELLAAFVAMQRNLALAYRDLAAANASLSDDIVRREQAEQALQAAKDELEEKVHERTVELQRTYDQLLHAEKLSAVGKLAASVAHEFNNPLFGIRNVLRGVQRRAVLLDSDRQLVEMAIRECDRIRDLIANLQQFNRPTDGITGLADVNRVLTEMLQFCQEKFSTRGIEVETCLAPALPLVEAVEDQLKQVFLNLLTNAEEAVADKTGHIHVETRRCHESALIIIQDNGVGIPAENLSRIFEPFFTTKAAVKGTGLGLPVSYGIIRRHNGRLTVRSTPGEGSTFTVVLPLRQGESDGKKTDSAG